MTLWCAAEYLSAMILPRSMDTSLRVDSYAVVQKFEVDWAVIHILAFRLPLIRWLMIVFLAVTGGAAAVKMVAAHPHVFVEARSSLVFDDGGKAVAIQHVFRFDDAFSAYAILGLDTNGDGFYSREELGELADINVESMAEFGYFTFGDNSRIELDFDVPTDYWLEVKTVALEDYWVMKPEDFEAIEESVRLNGGTVPEDVKLLELHFRLPMKQASDALKPITIDVYDPTYYVDFRFSRDEGSLGVTNAPSACAITRKDPPALDDATAYALAQVGVNEDVPPELQSAASSQVNQMIVNCQVSGALSDEAPSTVAVAEDGNADTVKAFPDQTPSSQLAELDSPVAGTVQVGLFDRVFGTIARLQSEFYQDLIAALRAFNSNPNAGWLLVGLSFAYGVFHAAGPGHGKAVISSYLVANNETLKKGIVLSFVSAFAQAMTAIVLVGGLAVVFNLTSIAIQDTARWFEIGSFALITGLGGWLLWQKAIRPLILQAVHFGGGGQLALAGASGHSHLHAHDHDESHHHQDHKEHHHHGHVHEFGVDGVCSTCGHAHAPTPDMIQGRIDLARAVSIVLAVGLRPCTGALVVLVFALSQGMLISGVAATLAMAVGTGITVSVLASLAVGARDLAVRLFQEGSTTSSVILRGIEVAGASLVFFLGLTFLIASIGWR